MARGRKPDAPALQAAKGNPGRRKGKRQKAAPERAAELAAAPPQRGDHLAPPAYMEGEKFAEELAVWNELVPELRKLNLLQRLDRYTFAMLCTHIADWIKATRDIKEMGAHYGAVGVAEQKLMRMNPAVKVREIAEKHILDIGEKFGLNPFARYKLLREQSLAGLGSLFDRDREPEKNESAEQPAPPAEDHDDPVGMFNRARGQLPN
jgi:P27 family predicted phage terminase small subunit